MAWLLPPNRIRPNCESPSLTVVPSVPFFSAAALWALTSSVTEDGAAAPPPEEPGSEDSSSPPHPVTPSPAAIAITAKAFDISASCVRVAMARFTCRHQCGLSACRSQGRSLRGRRRDHLPDPVREPLRREARRLGELLQRQRLFPAGVGRRTQQRFADRDRVRGEEREPLAPLCRSALELVRLHHLVDQAQVGGPLGVQLLPGDIELERAAIAEGAGRAQLVPTSGTRPRRPKAGTRMASRDATAMSQVS